MNNKFDYSHGMCTLVSTLEVMGMHYPEIEAVIAAGEAVPNHHVIKEIQNARLRDAIRAGDVRGAADTAITLTAVGSNPTSVATDNAEIHLAAALRELYPWGTAYSHVAERYNALSAEFGAVLERVAADQDPDSLSTDELPLWQSVPGMSAELDKLLDMLMDTYMLATASDLRKQDTARVLGLVAHGGRDALEDEQVSAIVKQWTQPITARGGCWSSIVQAGAVLKAPATVEEYASWL